MEENKLSEQIRAVVDARQTSRNEFSELLISVKKWENWVENILAFTSYNSGKWEQIIAEAGNDAEIMWLELKVRVENLQESIRNLLVSKEGNTGSLIEAYTRANRNYLNIGSIGPWRQGKSLLASKLTQLDYWIIPVSNGGKCTGTTINIINDSYEFIDNNGEKKQEKDVALIFLYSLSEICNILNQYFEKLQIRNTNNEILKINVSSKEDFKRFCINNKALIVNADIKVGMEGYKKTLDEYILGVEDYYNELTGEVKKISNLSSINSRLTYRPHVSYSASLDAEKPTYKVLATKKAEVYTQFKLLGKDVGKIQIVDTPGIGEKRIGVDEALTSALRKELDIAIALFGVKATYDNANLLYDFHRILKHELKGRKPEEWLFYLFNIHSSDYRVNKKVVEEVIKDVLADLSNSLKDEKDIKTYAGIVLNQNHIGKINCEEDHHLIGYKDQDLSMSNEKGIEPFFLKILEMMTVSIKNVDETFYEKARVEFNAIKKEYEELKPALKRLKLPPYETDEIIKKTLDNLHLRLKENGNIDVMNSIRDEISQLQNETIGTELIKLFLGNNATKEVNTLIDAQKKDIKENKNNKNAITVLFNSLKNRLSENEYFPEQIYDDAEEFRFYYVYKKKLLNLFKEHVLEKINEEEAIKKLEKEKEKICQSLKIDGKINIEYVDPEQWCDDFIALLDEDSANYQNLIHVFENFKKFEITIKNEVRKKIDHTLSDCLHEDFFGNEESIFTTYESTMEAFIISFYTIEKRAKYQLGIAGNSVKGLIEDQQRDVKKNITQISSLSDFHFNHENNIDYRTELERFYKNHKEFLADDERTIKQGIIDKWNRLIK